VITETFCETRIDSAKQHIIQIKGYKILSYIHTEVAKNWRKKNKSLDIMNPPIDAMDARDITIHSDITIQPEDRARYEIPKQKNLLFTSRFTSLPKFC
jgi:hypothetical protein